MFIFLIRKTQASDWGAAVVSVLAYMKSWVGSQHSIKPSRAVRE